MRSGKRRTLSELIAYGLGYEVVRFETGDAESDLAPLVQAILHAVRERIADLNAR